MDLGLKDKVALVTGAGSQTGFGKGIALTLAQEGCDVVIIDKDVDGAKKTAGEIEALGRKSLAFEVDVTNSSQVNDAVKAALEKFGRIDILVNNAGAATPPKPFIEKTEAEWDPDIEINLKSVLICTKAVLPQMLERKNGKIINISSDVIKVRSDLHILHYVCSKGAVFTMTQALARSLGPSHINVNAIAPGLTATEATLGTVEEGIEVFNEEVWNATISAQSIHRRGEPDDMAGTAVYLASEDSDFVTGQIIYVNAGLIGIGFAGAVTGANTLASDASPKPILGSIMGGLNTMQPIGVLFFLQVGGYLFDKVGYWGPFALKGIADVICGLWILSVRKRLTAPAQEEKTLTTVGN